jgi:hypothetical protein
MRFDPKTRRYVNEQGRVLSPSQVRKEVNDYITGEKEKTQTKAKQLLNGSVSLTSFFMYLKSRIETWHEVAGSIAYGGKAQIDRERQARINATVKSELAYLREFQKQAKASFEAARKIAKQVANSLQASPLKEIAGSLTQSQRIAIERELYEALIGAAPSEADAVTRKVVNQLLKDAGLTAEMITVDTKAAADLMGATIPSRAGMYADAAYSTFQNNELAREFDSGVTLGRRVCAEDDTSCEDCVSAADAYFVPLEDLPAIGSLQCLNNCRCYFETAEPHVSAGLVVDRSQQADAVQ